MSQHIDAVFENGVFRPEVPINLADGQRVTLNVESKSVLLDDLSDVADLLDAEYTAMCREQAGRAPSLDEVQLILSAFDGSLADRISQERDER
jgi:predicted DNA-binding antitoxin AbrB/MazE fold protein